jgi:hypothetical protein
VALRDSRSNLAHDLLDIDVLAVLARAALVLRLGRRRSGPAPVVPAAILTASPSMKVLPAAVLWILICHLFRNAQCGMLNAQRQARKARSRWALAIEHWALCLVQYR